MAIFRREPPPPNGGVECKGVWKITILDQHLTLSRNRCKIEPELPWKANRKPKLSNSTSFNDLEWPLTQISWSRHCSTSNNWKRYKIELYLQWRTNRKSYYDLSNGAIFNDLERPLRPVSRSRHSLTLTISECRYNSIEY